MTNKALIRRLTLAVLLSFSLVLLCNLPTVVSVMQPSLRSFLPGSTVQADSLPNDTFQYARLGITAPVGLAPDTSPLRETDWATISQQLTKGVSLSYVGESFDQAPLAFVTGHSSSANPFAAYGSVFASTSQAKAGDQFELNVGGTLYHYQVVRTEILPPTDVSGFLALTPTVTGERDVALVSCYPIFTTSKRFIVLGKRI